MSEVDDDTEIATALRAAPAWMTAEAVRDTLQVFRPLYKERLTVSDAVEILINMHNLYDLLKEQIENPSKLKTNG